MTRARDRYEETLDQEAADRQGLSLSKHQEKELHDKKMIAGAYYFRERQYRKSVIKYYLENKD